MGQLLFRLSKRLCNPPPGQCSFVQVYTGCIDYNKGIAIGLDLHPKSGCKWKEDPTLLWLKHQKTGIQPLHDRSHEEEKNMAKGYQKS